MGRRPWPLGLGRSWPCSCCAAWRRRRPSPAAASAGCSSRSSSPAPSTGALVGNVVNPGDLDLFIVIGVAAFLGAGYRVPLAAVMFVAETTGRPSFVVPGLIAAVAAELLMGRSSVTEYQLDHTMPGE